MPASPEPVSVEPVSVEPASRETTSPDITSGPVARFLDACAKGGVDLHSVQIRQDGRVLVDSYIEPYTADDAVLLYSISKSFTSTAAAFAIADGLIGLDDLVIDLLPQYRDADLPEQTRRFTLHHLLSMSTGHTVDTLEAGLNNPDDPALAILQVAPERDLGSCHVYNNGASFLVGFIVQQHTGLRLVDYLRPRLFDPIGAGPAWWDRVPARAESGETIEVDMGFTGLHLRPDALGRFTQLLLDDGRWQSAQLLPEGWVALASTKYIDTVQEDTKPDWNQGYGYQYWMARHGWRGDGAHGQFAMMLPEQRAAVAITSFTENMQVVLDAFWEHVLPALDERADLDSPTALALRALGSDVPAGTSAAVTPDGDDWLVTFDEGGEQRQIRCGDGRWVRSAIILPEGVLPVAASGGWTGRESFEARVLILTSPQSFRIHADGAVTRWAWDEPVPLRDDNTLARFLLT